MIPVRVLGSLQFRRAGHVWSRLGAARWSRARGMREAAINAHVAAGLESAGQIRSLSYAQGDSRRSESQAHVVRSPKALFLDLGAGKRKPSRHELLQVIHYIIGLTFNAVTPKMISTAFMIDIPINMDSKVTQQFIGVVLDKLRMVPVGSMSSRELSVCLSGLRRFDPRTVPQVHQLVEAIRPHLQAAILVPWTSRTISFAFFGLNRLSETSPGVPETLRLLSALLSTHKEAFGHRDIGNILYGFRNMTNKGIEVQNALESLLPHIEMCSGVLDSRTLGTSLYGLRFMSCKHPVLVDVLRALVARIHQSSEPHMDGQGIGNSLYGMQAMSEKVPEVADLIRVLCSKIEASNALLTSQEVSNAYFGLQSMTSSTPEVQRLLTLLLEKLNACKVKFTAQGISNILFGLQGMRSDDPVVEETIRGILPKLRSIDGTFQPIGICSALYGMKNFDSNSEAVRQLIAALVPHVVMCSDSFTARIVGTSLFGLQKLRCEHQETKDLLTVLADKIRDCKEPLGAQAVGNALYGLHSMHSSTKAVRDVLEALVPLIKGCSESLSAQELSNALYGMQNFTTKDACVVSLIDALHSLVRDSSSLFTEQGVGNSLYGLQGMSSSIPEVRRLVSALTVKVAGVEEPLSAQSASNSLYGLKSMNNDNAEVEGLLNVLAEKVENSATFGGQAMGISLYGLHSMQCDTVGIRRVLATLARKIDGMPAGTHIRSQEMANALYGLQGLNNAISELRGVLMSLLSKLRTVNITNSHELALSLFGLQSMDSESSIVRAVLVELTKQLRECSEQFTERDLTMAFFCLSCMNSSWKEVHDVLDILTEKLKACDCVDAQAMSSILYNLQGIGPDYEASERLLSAVVDKLRYCNGTITMQGIAMSLYGLKCMPEDSPMVHELVDYIARTLRNLPDPINGVFLGHFMYPLHALPEQTGLKLISALVAKESTSGPFSFSSIVPPGSMTPSNLSHLLYGIQRLDGSHALVADLHRFVVDQLRAVIGKKPMPHDPDYSPHQLQMLLHNMKIFLWYSKTLDANLRKELEAQYDKLSVVLSGIRRPEQGDSSFRSHAERKVNAALLSAFNQNGSKEAKLPKLTFNKILHSFEADATILFDQDGDSIVLNIEVDGPRHRHGNVRAFTERRDEVLAGAHGVVVCRLNEELLLNIDESNILNRIVDSLKSLSERLDQKKQFDSQEVIGQQKRIQNLIVNLERWNRA